MKEPKNASKSNTGTAPSPAEHERDDAEGQQEQTAGTDIIQLTQEEFSQLKAHIEALQHERDETVSLAQRLQADFDNYRRRNASIYADSKEEGERMLITELLPVIDGLDAAFADPKCSDASWLDGITLLRKQFMEILKRAGLSEIETDGAFDPEAHEAVMQVEGSGKNSGEIVEVFRKGYKVKERIIRHSMVNVAK